MNTFHDLFRQPTRGVNGVFPPDIRSQQLPSLVAASRHLHVWKQGQPTLTRGDRLLVGVATWSGYDLNLLDLIEEAAPSVHVDVFDIDICRSAADLDACIPGVGQHPNPPFAGLWRNGTLLEAAAGHTARDLICRVCGIDEKEMLSRLGSVLTRK